MSKKTVGMVMNRLLTDEGLRLRFARDRLEALRELWAQGLELTPGESSCSS